MTVALKLIYLVVTRALVWACLAGRDSAAKNVEILILRHQLAVAQRRDPRLARKLTWADRAWLALLAGLLLTAHVSKLRLIVTPGMCCAGTATCCAGAGPAAPAAIRDGLRFIGTSSPWYCAWPRRIRRGGIGGSTANWPDSASGSPPPRCGETLKAAGIDPAPVRDTGPTWAVFLRSQAEAILACDFVVVDLLDGSNAYVLAVIEHATRRVRILVAAFHPAAGWAAQQARNLIMDVEDASARAKFLIHDQDVSFGTAFDAVFTAAGVEVIRTGIQSLRQNTIMERWFRSLRSDLADRTLIWNRNPLMRLHASMRSSTFVYA